MDTTRRAHLSAVVLIAALLGAATVPTASAAEHAGGRSNVEARATLEITSTATDLVTPATAVAGTTRFHASTTDPNVGWIGLARLRPSVSWETFRRNLTLSLSDIPAEVVEGSAKLAETATLLGGVVIHPDLPGEFTQRLDPGTYTLFDYRNVQNAPAPRHSSLTVTNGDRESTSKSAATLVAKEIAGRGPRFELAGTLRPGQPLVFRNAMDGQLAEAVLFPIGDVTEARLKEWFDSFVDGSGDWPQNPPFDLTIGRGSLPLSPGTSSAISVPLEPGRFVAVNWLKSARDGGKMVKKGHYLIVEVT